MKKCLWICLCLALLLAGCGQKAAPEAEPITSTLMIYMMGSDLEAKSGAGTSDLQEIVQAGVDLEHNNVLVFAGGCPYWHNEVVGEDACSVLLLTAEGFTKLQTVQPMSMADPETLAMFLNYGYGNYPADRYGLVLWDHGSGPVMGYGKEELHEKDALLLEEMAKAMEASPFGPDNKLAWVGFDACLMASAELAITWADYADYMVSSQEVEPSIGWNYQFVNGLGSGDITQMLTQLTDGYMECCQAYFTERNYTGREATISCVDLSQAEALGQAIDALFQKAGGDVEENYDRLSSLRAQTRAFGRASTGSEYDLVDLGDLADKLSELYPQETAQLKDALNRAVIMNNHNTTMCSGLSLYYPFYNKDYFYKSIRGAESWQNTYQSLGVFSDYQSYLDQYQLIWNGTDRVDQFAASIQPCLVNNEYSLQLTQEQQSCYAGAIYYVLQRESEEMYTCVIASSDVENKDGRLVANFDGKAIYVKDKYGNYMVPVSVEEDRIGDQSHYSIFAYLKNAIPGTYLMDEVYLGGEKQDGSYRYHVVLDKQTDQLAISSLLPYDEQATDLVGGKLEDADLSRWTEAQFFQLEHKYLTRDANGIIQPLSQWPSNGWITGMSFYMTDDMEFVYEPLDVGEYYLMIEVRDTQGNGYCSELLPIRVDKREQEPETYQYPVNDVNWETGDRVLLTEQEDLALYMNLVQEKDNVRFALELENRMDCNANLEAYDLICNDSIYCASYYGTIRALPGQNAWFSSLKNMGFPEECGALEELESIAFRVQVRDERTGAMRLEPQIFRITLSEQLQEIFRAGCELKEYRKTPYMGALAGKQELYRDENMVLTLLGFGKRQEDFGEYLRYVVAVENLSQEALTIGISGTVLNGCYNDNGFNTKQIPAGRTDYLYAELSYELEDMGIEQIGSVALLIRTVRDGSIVGGYSTPYWCQVELSQKAEQPTPVTDLETVIYEKDGIRITVGEWAEDYGNGYFPVVIYNGTRQGINVESLEAVADGDPTVACYLLEGKAGPGQYCRTQLMCYDSAQIEQLVVSFRIFDIFEQQVIVADTGSITIEP